MDNKFRYLDKINGPGDLKKLKEEELIPLSKEIRMFLLDVLSKNPGHFGASLGVVELTVALHYAYNSPEDKIIWDVGHQAYSHKILTGRRDIFHTNRKQGGISGFPKMSESEHDAFGTGHSSTSISAALGIAVANHQHQNKDNQVVAVIGDGALTGGLAYEGLNNAGIEKTNLTVILNDNNMAIDESVGAMKEYLTDVVTSKSYNRMKNDVWKLLGYLSKIAPNAQKIVQNLENGIKSVMLKQSNLFESLNFRYFGPIDGHDVVYLSKILKDLKTIPGPKLLHVKTKKGKGFKFSEENQTRFHAPGKFDKETGEIFKVSSNKPVIPKYQEVFGHTVLDLAKENQKIIGITPAMPSGSSLCIMMDQIPERTYDVGIAEQHAITFAAGLSSQGMLPFITIYSSFLQRSYDQIIHDVALQDLPMVLCIDRAGIVGNDGPTHHGAYDISSLLTVPNIILSAPMDDIEMRNMMYSAQSVTNKPFVIRYPRGKAVHVDWRKDFESIEIGKGRKMKDGNDIALLSYGAIGNNVAKAADQLDLMNVSAAHYDMRFAKPLDEELLEEIYSKFNRVITIEDGAVKGGFGSAVLEHAMDNGFSGQIKRLGIPDKYIEHGEVDELYKICGFDVSGIVNTAKTLVKKRIFSNVG